MKGNVPNFRIHAKVWMEKNHMTNVNPFYSIGEKSMGAIRNLLVERLSNRPALFSYINRPWPQ